MVNVGVLFGFALLSVALPGGLAHGAHEAIESIPAGFICKGPASSHKPLKLRLALTQPSPNAIADVLYNVSDPRNTQYGQYLSKAEVEELLAPRPAAVRAVSAWLKDHNLNVTMRSPAGDWVGFEIPVGKANELFNANFSVFAHNSSGPEVIRTMAYSLPPALKGHVDFVHPTTSFPRLTTKGAPSSIRGLVGAAKSANATSPCANGTTPACLQQLYSIPLEPASDPDSHLEVLGQSGNGAHFNWLKEFLNTTRPDMDCATNFTVDSVGGRRHTQIGPSVYASTDELAIQYAVGLATNVPVVYISAAPQWEDDGFDGYLDGLIHLLAQDNPPQVLTINYGTPESSLSFALMDKLCKAYAQLGARGTSVLVASGDSAVGCPSGNNTSYRAEFPSSCPFVTSVGGTAGYNPEAAWAGSSGGFSNHYPRPSYQDGAVNAYLSQIQLQPGVPNVNSTMRAFNTSGRAFPDLAAKADAYQVYLGPERGWSQLAGTSGASTTVASIIALLNDRLASAGKPPLGFLNPWLYGNAAGTFTDLTEVSSSILCEKGAEPRGFDAVTGWDPVTGLGSPNFQKLLTVLGLI